MKPIKFIENLSFSNDNELIACGSNGRGAEIFMKQGDLDAACAIYSLMMMLIINHRINRKQLINRDTKPGYNSVKRLQDQFLGGVRGLYKGGYYFNDLRDELKSSFKKEATACTFSTISDSRPKRDDLVSKSELHNTIRETLDSGYPVQIGYSYKRGNSGHSVVAIGYQEYKEGEALRLFCLDPSHELAPLAYWNNIIDITLDNNTRSKYQDWSHAEEKGWNNCNVDEILIIE